MQNECFAFIRSALEEFHDGDPGLDNLLKHHSLELPSVLSAQPNHKWNRFDIAAGVRALYGYICRFRECLPKDAINQSTLTPILEAIINSTIFELLNVFGIDLAKHPGIDGKSPENTPSGFSLLQRLYEESRSLEPKVAGEALCRPESVEPKEKDGESAADFQYHCALDPTKAEVRVLEILPGVEIDTIKCNLVVRKLHIDGVKEALSYVWGTDATPVPIQVDNETFYIRRSLNTILRRLRYENKPREIWVDAICINQSDNKEKSHQVRLMRDIYSRAGQTTVWMGDFRIETITAKPGSPDLFYPPVPTEFRGTSINEYDLPTIVKEHLKSLKDPMSENRIAIQFMLERCINHILLHEWWERIWTMQEASLPSKAPIIIFKDCSFSFDDLIGAMNILLKVKPITFREGDIGNELVRAIGTIRLGHGYITRRFHARVPLLFQLRPGLERQRDATIRTLEYFLTITDTYKATNPLDKIFALESLLPRCVGRLINVDYSEDRETVFHRMTARVYCSRGLPIIKFYRFCFETTLAAGITVKGPSWVIDFTYSNASERVEQVEWLAENRVTLDAFIYVCNIIDISADADETCILPFATPKTLFCHGRCIHPIQITGIIPKLSDEEPEDGYFDALLSLIYKSIAGHELIGKLKEFTSRATPLLDLFCLIPEEKVDKSQERHAHSGALIKSRNQELFGKTYFITSGGIVGISTVPVEQGDILARVHTAPVYLILRDVEDAKGKSTAPQKHRIVARAVIAEALDNTRERILSAPDQELQIV
ncbi:HET-domain-containing protein [Xylaria arbuscula]|nr:HET-domain-containing protein [Xylaria arbuscula]